MTCSFRLSPIKYSQLISSVYSLSGACTFPSLSGETLLIYVLRMFLMVFSNDHLSWLLGTIFASLRYAKFCAPMSDTWRTNYSFASLWTEFLKYYFAAKERQTIVSWAWFGLRYLDNETVWEKIKKVLLTISIFFQIRQKKVSLPLLFKEASRQNKKFIIRSWRIYFLPWRMLDLFCQLQWIFLPSHWTFVRSPHQRIVIQICLQKSKGKRIEHSLNCQICFRNSLLCPIPVAEGPWKH